MSTLPGLASKGEKEKSSKYQSLDINKLYRVSLGESLEKQQQKSTLSQKHGMQSLGKVPSTRRPPANLPSLKSEHSGTDAAVSLVPANGSGWGKQENTVSTTSTPTTTTVNASSPQTIGQQAPPPPQLTPHQAAIALPVTTTIQAPIKPHPHPPSANAAAGLDKSWSSVIGNDPNAAGGHPPPYQSPQFQHEFPSLSAGDGAPPRTATDTQYAPGLSLRPQTEGSWLQGGGSARGAQPPPPGSLALSGGPPQLSGPVGQPLPPQVRGFVPNFMFRGSGFPPPLAANGHGGPGGVPPNLQPHQQHPIQHGQQGPGGPRMRQQRNVDVDEMAHRPIIKEEDLSGMDNLTGDMGWAVNDDIDYNQKLAFSDDDLKLESRKLQQQQQQQQQHLQQQPQQQQQQQQQHIRTNKDYDKTETHLQQDMDHKSWSGGRSNAPPRHSNNNNNNNANNINNSRLEEDEFSAVRRRQQQEIASAVERAKQRKEEEEKKFLETRQAAAKKLQELDERLGKSKRDKDNDETSGTINPASVPPQTIAPVPILLPEWERDKEQPVIASRAKMNIPASHPDGEHKMNPREASDFKHLTQIEGRATFTRKDSRSSTEKEPATSGGSATSTAAPHSFSKQFQNDLPPRFLKQQQLSQSSSATSFQYDNRWGSGGQVGGNRTSPNSRKPRGDDDKDADDRYRRMDDYRSHRAYGAESGRKSSDSRYEDYSGGKDRDYELKAKDRHEKSDSFDSISISRQSSEEWHGDKRVAEKYDRPQRPDSRDSRASRESRHSGDSTTRHSEPREYSSWAEEPLEEKKKELRMVVPGPITKEKIEADDLRSEKRNLTQLKRGSMLEKKLDDEDTWGLKKNKDILDEPKAWADSIPPAVEREMMKKEGRDIDDEKKDKFGEKDDKKMHQQGRGRSDSQGSRNQGWPGGAQVYRSTWSSNKKTGGAQPPRGQRGGKPTSSKGGPDMTESEGSADDAAISVENGSSPNPSKKLEKDEKNKEVKNVDKLPGDKGKMDKSNYVPRGEPSRHGRGGGAAGTFRGGRGGSKRIESYGPPAKSPFSNSDEKERKMDESEDDKLRSQSKDMKVDDKNRKKSDPRKPKLKLEGDISDNSDVDGRKQKSMRSAPSSTRRGGGGPSSRPGAVVDKRSFGGPRNDMPPHRQNSSGNIPMRPSAKDKDAGKDANALSSAIADISLKDSDALDGESAMIDDGFQEVKNKKSPIDRKIEKPQKDDKKSAPLKVDKDLKKPSDRGVKPPNQVPTPQLQQQQPAASIPSLMATPINPPSNIPPSSQSSVIKGQFDRTRQNKTLPPRFAKIRESGRMPKSNMPQGMCEDVKMGGGMYSSLKEGCGQHVVSTSIGGGSAWEKPLPSQLRAEDLVGVGMEACKSLDSSMQHPNVSDDKAVLDGSKPLNTIIFENTNYKSAPGARNRGDRPRKMEDSMDAMPGFKQQTIGELLAKEKNDIQFFNKEDTADMKLDFLESEISQITEDKSSKLSLRSNLATSNNILTADALNMKIQSVKKVWESNIPNMVDSNEDAFVSSFVTDPNSMDPNCAFSKGSEVSDESHDVYNSSPNPNASNSTTNVCKVKPTQQVAGSAGQALLNAGVHQPHSNMVGGPTLMGHTLSSPPPIQPVIGGLGQPPQQYTASQHISYQAGLGSNQYGGGIPAPSPPTVLNYSTQQLQQTAGLYAPFQIDQSQVMGSQGRSQYSQYSFGLGQTGSSPYSQSVYLQTGQPHAPPNAQPDIYQNMNSYRLPNTGPFGQNQQLNNPTTVLISSTSNSLMSPSVKPSNQQISAIGTKAGGVGQAYQQQSQQGQVYIPYDPAITANYMQSAGVMPRGPVQNNAALQQSALQASSSFYSGSTGGQTGYFQAPGSSTLQSQLPQHQSGFGMQQSVFPTHNQSHTNAGMQNYPYLSNQMQLAAMTQQFRTANMQSGPYMKNQMGGADQGRQQLKSPGSQQQEVLSSVFNSGPQIASPKSRQQMKQPPPQPSPTAQHNKYMYSSGGGGGMGNQQSGQQTRYPTPIQRPAGNYQNQLGGGGVSNNAGGNSNPKTHRINNSNNRSAGGRQYYGSQSGNINTQSEKADDKLADNSSVTVNASNAPSAGGGSGKVSMPLVAASNASSVNSSGDKPDMKEENCAKD